MTVGNLSDDMQLTLEPQKASYYFQELPTHLDSVENWWRDPLNLVKVVLFVSTPAYGKEVPAIIEQPLEEIHTHIGKNTVTYEARLLKALFYEVIGWNK